MNVTSHNCVYINCENNNRHQKGKSFFKFPVNNATKVKEWQKNCGNVTIACMEVNELKYKLLCEDHFLAEDIIFSDTSRKRKVLRKKAVPLKYTPQVDSPQLSTYEDVAPLFYDVKQEPASEMISIEETKLFQMPTVFILEDGPQPSTTEDVAPDSYGIKQEPEFETNSKEETKLFQMETEDGSKPSTTRDVPDCYDIKQEPEFETNSEEETKLFQMETDDSPQPSTYEDVDPFFHDIKQESASETISEEETKLFQTPTDNLAWLPPSKLPKLEAADEPSTYTASISSTTSDESKVSDLISQMASPSQGSKTEVVQWTRQQLFDAVHEEWDKNLDTLIEILGVKLLNKAAHLFHIEDRSRQALKKVICNLKMKWRNAYRIEDRFLKNNKSWLDDSISITVVFLDQEASANDTVDSTKSRHSGGRPQTSFFESSDRSKRRKAQKLGESYSADELSYATKMVLRESGAISADNLRRILPKQEVTDGLSTYTPSISSTTSDESKVSDPMLQVASPSKDLEKKVKFLKFKITELDKKLKAQRSQSYRLKKKLEGLSVSSVLDNLLKDESDAVKTFVDMQLVNNNGKQWRTAERELAMSLYQKSPSAYKFMRENLEFHLPSMRIVQAWLKSKAKGENCSSSEETVAESQIHNP